MLDPNPGGLSSPLPRGTGSGWAPSLKRKSSLRAVHRKKKQQTPSTAPFNVVSILSPWRGQEGQLGSYSSTSRPVKHSCQPAVSGVDPKSPGTPLQRTSFLGAADQSRCLDTRSSLRRFGRLSTAPRPLDLSLSDWPAIKSRRSISVGLARASTPRTMIPRPGVSLSHPRRRQRRGRAPARAVGRAGDGGPETRPSTRSRF